MALTELRVLNVRNLQEVSFKPSPQLNIISGANGSGKTSLLESIYLLSRTKSFRTHSINKVISKGKDALVVSGKIIVNNSQNQLGIKKNKDKTLIRINGIDQKKTSELSSYLQVHLIRPETQTLLERGAGPRRTFLDWGVFHVKHEFLAASKKYNKTLKQRNALLKSRSIESLEPWNKNISEYGTILTNERDSYTKKLNNELRVISKTLLGISDFDLSLKQGWESGVSLLSALKKNEHLDVLRKFTNIGAHRADIQIRTNDCLAQDYLSRGQMKLLVLALCLAQVKISSFNSGVKPCVLIDDLSAELDNEHLQKVMRYLIKLDAQIFITTTDPELFSEFGKAENTKLFHVEHGCLSGVS